MTRYMLNFSNLILIGGGAQHLCGCRAHAAMSEYISLNHIIMRYDEI